MTLTPVHTQSPCVRSASPFVGKCASRTTGEKEEEKMLRNKKKVFIFICYIDAVLVDSRNEVVTNRVYGERVHRAPLASDRPQARERVQLPNHNHVVAARVQTISRHDERSHPVVVAFELSDHGHCLCIPDL